MKKKTNMKKKITMNAETARLTQSGTTLTILNDYSNSATGCTITLDFSKIAVDVPGIADEAMATIRHMYMVRAASPFYFKIMVPAIEKFAEYAKAVGIGSFVEYNEKADQEFMKFLEEKYGDRHGIKYLKFCRCIPNSVKTELEEIA